MSESAPKRDYAWQAPELMVNRDAPSPVLTENDIRSIGIGVIGCGLIGESRTLAEIERLGINVTAICDVDTIRMYELTARIKSLTGQRPRTYHDFRALVRASGVDAVCVNTPDHWHALQAMDAMQCGKDVYVEKPISLTIREGREIAQVAEKTGRICQTGSQQRSSSEFRVACELVRNGAIGNVTDVYVTIPANNRPSPPIVKTKIPIPTELDYPRWLGPAPEALYQPERCHYSFRFISDYSGGQLTNWGSHVIDIAQWGLDMDTSGPVSVSGTGTFPDDGLFDTAVDVDITWGYASGVKLHCKTQHGRGGGDTRFVGSLGEIRVSRGSIHVTPEDLLKDATGNMDILLECSNDHMLNFLSSIKTRKPPICSSETGHRSATVCHLGNIAMALGRPLQWDPKAECFIDDSEADSMLERVKRDDWKSLPSSY